MDVSYASSTLLKSYSHALVRPVLKRILVTGTGSVPATTGAFSVGADFDLLNMPGSGYERPFIAAAKKIAGMKVIDANRLRVAIADVGTFRSQNLMVLDIDLITESVSVRSVYEFDPLVDRRLLSVHVMDSGSVIVAGENGYPFLMKWDINAGFLGEVPYIDASCGDKGLFGFSLPIYHGDDFSPESYSLLQSENEHLYAVVVGIRQAGDVMMDMQGIPEFGIAVFDESLVLLAIHPIPQCLRVPDRFQPGFVRMGFVGDRALQVVGYRRGACRELRPMQDAYLRFVDYGNFITLDEMNYGEMLGRLYENPTDDIVQMAGVAVRDGIDVFAGFTESPGKGLFSYAESVSFLNEENVISAVRQNNSLYVLSHGASGLRLLEYVY